MRVSYRWLKDYVDFDLSPEQLADKLTMAGFEVEDMEKIGGEYTGVVTALIEKVEPHPDADKLTVCTVYDGDERVQVVCGAPNTEAGKIAPLAKVGARLPEGKVKKAKLRGVESRGMLCSKKELGYGQDHSGLWYFPAETTLGVSPEEISGLTDWVIEIGVTPNRPDCLSAIGIARELAAIIGSQLQVPSLELEQEGGAIDQHASVTILDPEKCPRYTGILVRGVNIAPSPEWMVSRLEAAGVRSINNVVDITNFVLLEYNQPLHAFDFDFLAGHKIVVRRATDGEKIVTLDEQEFALTEDDLLICDGEKPVALAGIMGGMNSLVAEETKDVFIESAFFEPTGIRRSSKRLGLASESSYRFERGIDLESVHLGLHRAARLMEELAGGKVVPGYIDNYPQQYEPRTIRVRPQKVSDLIGVEIPIEEMTRILRSLQLTVETDGEVLQVQVPGFRVDLTREVDITEEVARIYGFENIPGTLHKGSDLEGRTWPLRSFLRNVRKTLVGLGLTELNSNSLLHQNMLQAVSAPAGIRLINPLAEELSVLRTSLLPSLLKALAYNRARFVPNVKVFEARRVYLPREGREKPEEKHFLGVLAAGAQHETSWAYPEQEVDFFTLKGVVEVLLQSLGIVETSWRRPKETAPYLPGACAEIEADGKILGRIGKLNADVLDHFELKGEVFAGELELDILSDMAKVLPEIEPVSKYPPALRDIAVVADLDAPVDEMQKAVINVDSKRIAEVVVFDVYLGKGVPEGKKSVAFSIRYQDKLKSLSDVQADGITARILKVLQDSFGATIRE